MNRREFLKGLSIATAAAGFILPRRILGAEDAVRRRPNVLFVFSDMQRAYSMGCYGDANARTPQLDRFATQGVKFDAAMSTTPVCCPFRACLMTGQYAHHNGVVSNGVALDKKVKCLGEAFRDAGYATGYIGKWHIQAGDDRLGFPGEEPNGIYQTRHDVKPCADWTISFIERHARGDQPWMCVLSWLPPHSPYKASPGYAGHFKNVKLPPNVPAGAPCEFAQRALPDYYGMIEEIDVEFGRIMATLDRLGVAEDTIVVYTSDHGDMIGCQGYTAKRWPYEESARIPFLVRYPRQIKPGQAIADPIGAPDFYPTVAGLAGLPAPAGVDGLDFSGMMTGGAKPPREYVYLSMPYAYVPWPGWRALRTRQYSYARTKDGPWLLYDIEKDPFQQHNLAGDPANKALVEQWDQRLAAIMKETGDSWECKATKGDMANWLPGGGKQKGNWLGVPWPGCAVSGEVSSGKLKKASEGDDAAPRNGKKKAGKKGNGKGGGRRAAKRAAKK